MAKVNLGQTRPSNMPESYTSQLYQDAQESRIWRYFLHGVKKELFQKIE